MMPSFMSEKGVAVRSRPRRQLSVKGFARRAVPTRTSSETTRLASGRVPAATCGDDTDPVRQVERSEGAGERRIHPDHVHAPARLLKAAEQTDEEEQRRNRRHRGHRGEIEDQPATRTVDPGSELVPSVPDQAGDAAVQGRGLISRHPHNHRMPILGRSRRPGATGHHRDTATRHHGRHPIRPSIKLHPFRMADGAPVDRRRARAS